MAADQEVQVHDSWQGQYTRNADEALDLMYHQVVNWLDQLWPVLRQIQQWMALESCGVFLSFAWGLARMITDIAFLLKRTWFLLCSATSSFSAVVDHEEMCIRDHSSYKRCSYLSRAPVYIATCDDGSDRMVASGGPLPPGTFDANQLCSSLGTNILDMRLSSHLVGSNSVER
jgi:hypothetical protein